MNKNALIIFIKNPVLGKVKTRLANELGEENALKIYKALLLHTWSITNNTFADKYVFYTDYTDRTDLWENDIFSKELQIGNNLGERMKNAFETMFIKGYGHVVIIGSDCYELNQNIIAEAFNQLKENDVVIGPAYDGGYYLLGMNTLIPQLFADKTWSTESVFIETVKDIKALHYSMHCCITLKDVDTPEDVNFDY